MFTSDDSVYSLDFALKNFEWEYDMKRVGHLLRCPCTFYDGWRWEPGTIHSFGHHPKSGFYWVIKCRSLKTGKPTTVGKFEKNVRINLPFLGAGI